jgi:hypothetical protein
VAIDNVPNLQGGVTPDPTVTALIDKYDALAASLANVVIGGITSDILRASNAAGESALGDVIADAQLTATAPVGFGESVVAFMNPGGIRSDLLFVSSGAELDGEVTFGEAFGVQPFGNSLVTMTLTGAQIHTLLEQQWLGQPFPRILQVSDGFTYTWDASQPDGSKVDASTIKIGGVVVVPGSEYRVTVNSFLAVGGDNFSELVNGTNRLGGEVDLDALVTYFGDNTPPGVGARAWRSGRFWLWSKRASPVRWAVVAFRQQRCKDALPCCGKSLFLGHPHRKDCATLASSFIEDVDTRPAVVHRLLASLMIRLSKRGCQTSPDFPRKIKPISPANSHIQKEFL